MPRKIAKSKSKFVSKIYFYLSNDIIVNIDDFEEVLNLTFADKVKIYVNDDTKSDVNLIYNIYLKSCLSNDEFKDITNNIYIYFDKKFNIFYKNMSSTQSYDYKNIVAPIDTANKKEKYNFIDDDNDDNDDK